MRLVALAFALALVALRVVAAADLPPFGDEAFYWQCAQHPDIHYADHPFMTALLVRAGTALLGDGRLGIRIAFLACGVLLPFAVAWLARTLVGPRDAFWAGLLVLIVPGFAATGSLATPDGPYLLLVALGLVALERALASDARRWWVAAGVITALGLATHYRFVLFPFATLLVLVLSARGRGAWRRGGPWIAGLIGLLGLLPAVIHNVRLDFAPLRYQLGARHAAHEGLENLGKYFTEQAGAAVTPLLYAALILALADAVRRARRGDAPSGVAAVFAGVWIGLFLIASPWSDGANASAHWPLAGYVPLLPFVPGLLRAAWAAGGIRAAFAALAPASAALAVALLLVDMRTEAFGFGVRNAFLGWDELAARARRLLADEPRPLIAADNYMTGAALDLRLGDRADVYVLDHPKNVAHGRAGQYVLWDRDEAALRREHAGHPALYVMDTSAVTSVERPGVSGRQRALFERPRWRDEIVGAIAPDGRIERHFVLFTSPAIR